MSPEPPLNFNSGRDNPPDDVRITKICPQLDRTSIGIHRLDGSGTITTDGRLDATLPGSGEGRSTARQSGLLDGVLLYWEANLAPGVSLSTRPDPGARDGNWRVELVLAGEGLSIDRGDEVTVSVTFSHPPLATFRLGVRS
jgi:hypothetical protein